MCKALEQGAAEKQVEVQKSRSRAKQAWDDLRQVYQDMKPEEKEVSHQSVANIVGNFKLANKFL